MIPSTRSLTPAPRSSRPQRLRAGVRLVRDIVVATSAAALILSSTGCYNYAIADRGALAPGTNGSLELTDQGRVAVAPQLGAGVLRVEGAIVSADTAAIVMRVSGIETIAGQRSHWAGETVRIPSASVAHVSTRQLSTSRTWLAVGIAAAAIGIVIFSLGLNGHTDGTDRTVGPGNPPDHT